ncbi:MAG TPA: hypothetical protein VE131_06070 [Terriglobales bacterium]|nr:hypothetical protein [Terriglobales bacterium]
MQSGYFGIDVSQMIFAGVMVLLLIVFGIWAIQIRRRVKIIEKQLRDFRELEPEGYQEPKTLDAISEGARLETDEQLARESDVLEQSS